MTPVRKELKPSSALLPLVHNGLGAVLAVDKARIEETIRTRFADSLDIDSAFAEAAPNQHRWDYLLGDSETKVVVGLEPHSAKQDEVSRIIAKKKNALQQLRAHWKTGSPVVAWFWVASGDVQFPDVDRTQKQLAQENITFVGKQLRAKHLKGR